MNTNHMKNLSLFIRHCFALCGLLVLLSVTAYEAFGQQAPFITTWRTDSLSEGSSGIKQIRIPGFGTNYTIEWQEVGNPGNSGTIIGTNTTTINLPSVGTYQVKISGGNPAFSHIRFDNRGDKKKLLSIDQWGDIEWGSMRRSFYGCSNMTSDATDKPNLTSVNSLSMSFMFAGCEKFNGDISSWNTSKVTSMYSMFWGASEFNQPIGGWNTSRVTNMYSMFSGASKFNQPIGNWVTNEVINMSRMFSGAHKFNYPIGNWNTSKVTDMSLMFYDAQVFNQPIGNWVTDQVTDMSRMFARAYNFNQPIGNWNTSLVTDMTSMFNSDTTFNQPISNWVTDQVTNMSRMFWGAIEFNQPIGNWNTENVTDMSAMFSGAYKFNQPIGNWNTSKVTTMNGMFAQDSLFNQPLNNWDTGQVTDMTSMFSGASKFNQPLDNWNTSQVIGISSMFSRAYKFNQPIGNWNTSKVMYMRQTFYRASAFNQPLGGWNVSQVMAMEGMLYYCAMDVVSYDQTLTGWGSQTVQSGVDLWGYGREYCAGNIGRQNLIQQGWNINGDDAISCAPEINIRHIENNIASGDIFDMGTVEVGSISVNYRFRIENLGTSNLTLLGNPKVQLQGAHTSDFILVQNQVVSPIEPGSGRVFDLKFSPSQMGTREASLVIYNDDSDENPYIIHLTGQGLAVPEIKLYQNNALIPSGGSYDMGAVDLNSSSEVINFDIHNTGLGDLILTGQPGSLIQVSGHTNDFTVIQSQVTSPIAPQASRTFSIRFHPTVVGNRSISLLMNHNAQGGTYSITISGVGISVPDIHIVHPLSGNDIPSGSNFDMVTNQKAEFLITNLGSGGLILGEKLKSAVTITGPDAKDFKLLSFSYVFGAGPGQKVAVFTIQFTGSGAGTRHATVSVYSNDPDENPYTIHLRGNNIFTLVEVDKQEPQMHVSPNPTADQLTLRSENWRGQTIQINIQNAQGRLVATQTIKQAQGEINLNVSKYKAGWYVLVVSFNKQRLEYRFLKR